MVHVAVSSQTPIFQYCKRTASRTPLPPLPIQLLPFPLTLLVISHILNPIRMPLPLTTTTALDGSALRIIALYALHGRLTEFLRRGAHGGAIVIGMGLTGASVGGGGLAVAGGAGEGGEGG